MLHFALNVQVILSGQTQKVWVSTYSNVLYSLLTHTGEHTRAFSYNLHPLLIGYLVAVIYKVGTAKQRREEKLGKQKSSMHEFKRRVFQVLTCSFKNSLMQHDVAQNSKARCQGYQQCAVYHSKTFILQARLDTFPLFQKKKKRW